MHSLRGFDPLLLSQEIRGLRCKLLCHPLAPEPCTAYGVEDGAGCFFTVWLRIPGIFQLISQKMVLDFAPGGWSTHLVQTCGRQQAMPCFLSLLNPFCCTSFDKDLEQGYSFSLCFAELLASFGSCLWLLAKDRLAHVNSLHLKLLEETDKFSYTSVGAIQSPSGVEMIMKNTPQRKAKSLEDLYPISSYAKCCKTCTLSELRNPTSVAMYCILYITWFLTCFNEAFVLRVPYKLCALLQRLSTLWNVIRTQCQGAILVFSHVPFSDGR